MTSARKSAEALRRVSGFKRVLINLPESLWDEIDKSARDNWRTRTAEVQLRLESTFQKDAHGVMVGQVPARRK